ncbi:glycoside hydrolase family 65 protein, partial [Staphylococcus aureus]
IEKTADPRQARKFADKVLIPEKEWHSDRRRIWGFRTARSGMTLAVGADHEIITENEYAALIDTKPGMGKRVYRVEATQGRPNRIDKAVA